LHQTRSTFYVVRATLTKFCSPGGQHDIQFTECKMNKCTYHSVICISLRVVRSLLGNGWNCFGGLCGFTAQRIQDAFSFDIQRTVHRDMFL